MVEKCGVTETDQDRIDRLMRVNRIVRPRCNDMRDSITDDDLGELAGWVVEITTKINLQQVNYLKWSFASMLCVGSEELGSFHTKYWRWSAITTCSSSGAT